MKQHISKIEDYEKYKPIYDKYKSIRFEKSKAKYYSEHESEIEKYKTAVRYMKANHECKPSAKAEIKSEISALTEHQKSSIANLSAHQSELRELEEIRYIVNQAMEHKENEKPSVLKRLEEAKKLTAQNNRFAYKKQIHEELLDDTVAEVFSKLVNNPKFAAYMQQKITMKVDTSAIEQEIANYEKQLRHSYSVKSRLIEEIDSLDPDDKHYIKHKADLDDRLYKMYDKIEDTENLLIEARAKKTAIEAEKLTADNIYKVLIYFDKLYAVMDEFERRKFMESLVSEVHVYEERKPNGQWLKSIKLNLPIIEEDMELCLDNETHVECVVQLCKAHVNKTPLKMRDKK